MLVIFPVVPLTRRGATLITARHGSLDRLIDFVRRRPVGESAPVPVVDGSSAWHREPFGAADVIGAVCHVPYEPPKRFAVEVRPGRFEAQPAPADGDLDATGTCRCGCGYVRGEGSC